MQLPDWLRHPSQRKTTTIPAEQVPSRPLMPGGPPPTFAPWLDVLNHPSQRQSYLERVKAQFPTQDPMQPESYAPATSQGSALGGDYGNSVERAPPPMTATVRPPQRPVDPNEGHPMPPMRPTNLPAQEGSESTGNPQWFNTPADYTQGRNHNPHLAYGPESLGTSGGVPQPTKEAPGSGFHGFTTALTKPGTAMGDFGKTPLASIFKGLFGQA